jgi:all-trans-retinol 13,14-reductase
VIGASYKQFSDHDTVYDDIVIGSGLGGMSTAAILAKHGHKVLLLEKHFILGGYTHTFKRPGYEWDVGLHYVGQVHLKGTLHNKIFRYLSDEQLEWSPLDDVYDRAVFGDKEYEFVAGRDNMKQKLKEYFPAEKDQASIDRYFELLDEVNAIGVSYYVEKVIPPVLAKLFGGFLRKKLLKYSDRITLDVLREITDNEELIGVLTSQYGDYGLVPSKSSFYMHGLLANHYMEGGAYPLGGAVRLAETIVDVIEKNGGTALFSAGVDEIMVEGNKAVGVKMADGKVIRAKRVISNAGVPNTFKRLLPEPVRRRHKLEEKLKPLEPSAAHIGLYLGVEESPEDLKLPKCNYWVFPDQYDHDKGRDNYKTIEDEIPVAFVSFPAAKDPLSSQTYPGKSTVEAIIIVPYEWFTKWEGTEWHKREETYERMKAKVADDLLEVIYRVAPQLKGKIAYREVSTPLSTNWFSNYKHGEIYGLSHTPERFRQRFLKPHTPVKNLYLSGQDVMVASIAGSLMGGVLCASAILRKDVTKHIHKTIK